MLQLPKERLKELGADVTVREILGQPNLWRKVFKEYKTLKPEIDEFLAKLIEKYGYLRVLFTGAGSSQYVGDTVVKSLVELGDVKHFRFESIGSTDIVSAPQSTFEKETPTLLVSFARSGNSPESVAAVEIADSLLTNVYHLVITCAKDGKLAKYAKSKSNALICLLPEESNDQGFAMTGSCSSMTLFSTLTFSQENLTAKAQQVETAATLAEAIFRRENEIVQSLSEEISRVVYVGSGSLGALARELQLKILELTAGKIATVFDSSMGLRHGPKSFIDTHTAAFIFCANVAYTRQYDLDLYHEVKADGIADKITLIGQNVPEGFIYDDAAELREAYLVFPAFAFAHVVAINASILVNNTPDTPSASGTVNRVVKGVTIHSLRENEEQ